MSSLTHLINAITLRRGLSQLSEMEYRGMRSGNSEGKDVTWDLDVQLSVYAVSSSAQRERI